MPRSHQIARAYKAECEKRGVPGYLRGVDVTGAPSFGDIVTVEVSSEALKVNFSGKSSKRTTGMDNVPANTRYSTSGTELWFSAKEMLQTRQLVGLVPDVCAELIERRYIVNGDVVRLEEKKDMKKRTGESPDLADALLSTGQMITYVQNSPAQRFIVATEVGMIHPLQKARPDAEYFPAGSRGVCPNMKKITLEKVLASLADRQYPIEVPEEIRRRAERALQRMVEILPEK